MALWRHIDNNSAAIYIHCLDFEQTRDLISLVNDNHMDNNIEAIVGALAFPKM